METFQWCDQLAPQTPEPRRPLTLPELRRLHRLGFPELAVRLAAGTCPDCGLNRNGRTHQDLCATEQQNPKPAAEQPPQPWEVKPSRFAA